jgi:proton-dependent oligopeptide transporter, POT family
MAIGEFVIVGGSEMLLFWGMAVIIVGNGLFKPNISTMVGKLYPDGDHRKDSGFTIFYIGINLGALLATTVCAEVGNIYGAQAGFALAGMGMLLGVIIFQLGSKHYQDR